MSLIFFHYSQDIYIKLENCYFKTTQVHWEVVFSLTGIVITVPTVTWLFTIQSSMVIMRQHFSQSDMMKKKLEEEYSNWDTALIHVQKLLIPMNNSMLFDSVNFTANTAYNGGGASLFISSIR